MKLKLASPEQVALVYARDLKPSFPPAELKPLANIQAMCRDGCYRPWCLFDGEEIAGECFLWLGRPGWALLDYLCVAESRRNSGAGALMLKLLRQAEGDTVILVESEAPVHAPDPAMAERRLGFYARNGAVTLGYDCALFGVHFKTICWAGSIPEEAEVIKKHQEIYLQHFGREKYDQYIQIPLLPGEKPRPVADWTE